MYSDGEGWEPDETQPSRGQAAARRGRSAGLHAGRVRGRPPRHARGAVPRPASTSKTSRRAHSSRRPAATRHPHPRHRGGERRLL